MIESELAFNANGEPFAVPEDVTGWRVKRLRGGRGAPELVYAREGGPLVLGIDAGMDELREAVDVSGRYRLDAVDDDGKAVANVPPSYVQVTVAPRNSSMPEPAAATALASTDHVVRELAHANAEMMRQHTALAKEHTELAKVVATQQPELMRAAAEILRAADGAGLPRREPMAYDDDHDEDLEDDQPEAAARPAFNLIAAIQEAKPLLAMLGVNTDRFLAACGVRVPTAAKPNTAPGGSPQVAPQPRRAVAASTPKHEPTHAANHEQTAPTSEPEPFLAADPNAHVLAIQAQLAPEERAFVQSAMQQLTPADLIEWRDRLAQMPVEEAVAEIRAEIEKRKQTSEEN